MITSPNANPLPGTTDRSGTRPCVPTADAPIRHAGTPAPTTKSRLWLWFIAAFVLQAAAWTAWFIIASRHKVAEVPLEGAISNKPSDKLPSPPQPSRFQPLPAQSL